MAKSIYSRQQGVLLKLLHDARVQADVTQEELAVRLGITQSEVSKFERGQRSMDMLQLRAWLSALGVPLDAFAELLDSELEALAPLQSFNRQLEARRR